MFLLRDFNSACIKSTIASLLNYAIITGALIVKFPQILKIINNKSVAGLSSVSFYLETFAFTSSVAYNYAKRYPLASYGEGIFILIQNYILVGLLWHYAAPTEKPSTETSFKIVAAYTALAAVMFSLPVEFLFILPLVSTGTSLISRLPQIWENYRNGNTGQLAFLTTFLTFGGTAARVFTTIQGTMDLQILAGFLISFILNGILLLQILFYYKETNKIVSQREGAKKKKLNIEN